MTGPEGESMAPGDQILLTGVVVYLALLIGFLVCLHLIPRIWRLVIYVFLCAAHLFAGYVLYSLGFISRNIASGQHAKDFFTALPDQLSMGTVNPEYLELPGYALPILLSLLESAAVIGGGVLLWRQIRWYSRPLLIGSFILSFFLFDVFRRSDDRQMVSEHNELRRRVYTLIERKRAQHVTRRQMADSIAAGLKDFQYSYENRNTERRSVARILSALQNLTPQEKVKASHPAD